MATQAHCAYCFESLVASFEQRQPLPLKQVHDLWTEYEQEHGRVDDAEEEDGDDAEMTDAEQGNESAAKPAAIPRLLNHTPTKSSSSSSSTATKSSTSSTATSTPLFVTWNTRSASGHKSLRGCIGTFQAQELSKGLRVYALTSAFEDHRFSPIPASLLPLLQCSVTLLTNFSAPDKDPMNWTIGKHGLRISFSYHGRKYGATYLPDVAKEQGWTKEEALVSLMRKAGWTGRKDDWRRVQGLEIVRYEGSKIALNYDEWKDWRTWVDSKGVVEKPLN